MLNGVKITGVVYSLQRPILHEHLAKVQQETEEKLKKKAKFYNKSYLGEMVHVDTKRLPLCCQVFTA